MRSNASNLRFQAQYCFALSTKVMQGCTQLKLKFAYVWPQLRIGHFEIELSGDKAPHNF